MRAAEHMQRIRRDAELEGYQVWGEYQNSRSRLRFKCPEGHSYTVQAQTWQGGSRCSECTLKRRAKQMTLTPDDVDQRLSAEGYSRLSAYVSYCDPLTVCCPRQHQWRTTAKNFTLGHRCPTCSRVNRRVRV